MKRTIALLLALVMVFALCACGNKEEAKPSTLAVCPKAAVMRKKGSSAWTANAGLSTPAVTKALTTVDKADAVSHLSPRLRP